MNDSSVEENQIIRSKVWKTEAADGKKLLIGCPHPMSDKSIIGDSKSHPLLLCLGKYSKKTWTFLVAFAMKGGGLACH